MQFEAVACRLFLHYSYTLAQKASNYGIFCFNYKVKDDEIEITVFSRYIDKNTYLKVQYLPHTKYGAIVEIK